MTRLVILVSIGIGATALSWGFAEIDYLFATILILLLGAGWIYAQWSGVQWSSMTGLVGAGIFGGGGILLGANSAWMLAGVLFSLFAWDLIAFQTHLSFASSTEDAKRMERKHLLFLGMLAVFTLTLYLATVFIHLQLGLWWLILLAFVMTFGLVQLLWQLK